MFLLVLVGSLPASPGLRARAASFYYVLALLISVALVGRALHAAGLQPQSYASSVRKYAAQQIQTANERNLLIIDGGSYVVNGVDTEILIDELKLLGYSARAIKLAIGAGNHFERYRLNEEVRDAYRGGRAAQRLLYLAEVHSTYDQYPLAQFEQNEDTDRVYHYLSISNSWYASRALRSPNVETPFAGAWRWRLLRHTMVNAFNAGALNRLVPDSDIEPVDGRSIDKHPPMRRFPGLGQVLRELKRPVRAITPLPWLTEIRELRLVRLWQPGLSELVYFGLPSTTADQLAYVRAFCATTKHACISPADQQLISDLSEKQHWRNKGHMRASGAEIYSRWLARQLHAQGLLRK